MKTLFEIGNYGKKINQIPTLSVAKYEFKREYLSDVESELPEVSVSKLNEHYETILGGLQDDERHDDFNACAYHSPLSEQVADLKGFSDVHPLRKKRDMQGSIETIFRTQEYVKALSGATAVSLLPSFCEQAEYALFKMVKKFHKLNGNENKNVIIVPSNGDVLNADIAKLFGFEIEFAPVNDDGFIDFFAIEGLINENTALVAVRFCNQLCQIEKNALKVSMLAREKGALSYIDIPQTQPFIGILRGIDMYYDFMILNLAEFTDNHCLGGEGVFAICASERVSDYLPAPIVTKDKSGSFSLSTPENSIGQLRNYYGNFEGILKAYCYLASLGKDGFKNIAEMAVLNANYLMKLLENHNSVKQDCFDRFIFKAKNKNCTNEELKNGVLIKVLATQSKQELDELAALIISVCENRA